MSSLLIYVKCCDTEQLQAARSRARVKRRKRAQCLQVTRHLNYAATALALGTCRASPVIKSSCSRDCSEHNTSWLLIFGTKTCVAPQGEQRKDET